MFNLFTKPKPAPFPTWEAASQYAAQGFELVPVELSRATAGFESASQGPWGFGVSASSVGLPAHNVPAILGARLPWPNSNVSVEEMRKRWVAFVRLDIRSNSKVAKACEAIVRIHVGSAGPARLTDASTALLLPFRIEDVRVAGIGEDPHKYTMTTGSISCPGDTISTGISSVSVAAPGAAFIPAGGPYVWRDSDLLQVGYAGLPALSVMQAVAVVGECRDYLESLKPKPAPTALQLRLDAARRRAQAEA